jgi:hypothetical protein
MLLAEAVLLMDQAGGQLGRRPDLGIAAQVVLEQPALVAAVAQLQVQADQLQQRRAQRGRPRGNEPAQVLLAVPFQCLPELIELLPHGLILLFIAEGRLQEGAKKPHQSREIRNRLPSRAPGDTPRLLSSDGGHGPRPLLLETLLFYPSDTVYG